MNMKKASTILLAVAALSVASYAIMNNGTSPSDMKTFSSQDYGLSFDYPDRYELSQRDLGSAQRKRYEIALVDKASLPKKGEPTPSEGPTAITIDVLQNDIDELSAYDFVTKTADSNYKLGDGRVSTTTRGSLAGLEYSWSGLYEGRSFVVSRPRYVYMFSVTRLDPEDRILPDFDRILESAKIE